MADEEISQTLPNNKRNILICVDGSDHSGRAFNFYLERLCQSGDHVIVFHAMEVPTLPAAPYPYGFAYYEEWQQVQLEAVENTRKLLRGYGDMLKPKLDVTFKLIKEGGKSAQELICKNVKEESIAMVVMGTRGLSTLRRTFLGSVSDYVVHHARIPVCIVPS